LHSEIWGELGELNKGNGVICLFDVCFPLLSGPLVMAMFSS
jgi:hypothetical protein